MSEMSKSSKNSCNLDATAKSIEETICIIGMGYVGIPLAIEFDRQGFDVIGYDVDENRIDQLQDSRDPTGEIGRRAISDSKIVFTAQEKVLRKADYVIVAVPTPIDDLKNPNLKYVEAAGDTIGEHIKSGTTIILESTVYPGATREILAPAIEEKSDLTLGEGFYIGYSPERMVPGNSDHGIRDVVQVVSGQNETVLNEVAALYESVSDAGVHRAPEIEVAEATKCIENIQRDLNIALINELAIACHHLDLDTHHVLEAARTKWNFHDYRPGLVGGHCIPVDPFFMIYESSRNGFEPKLIEQAREINEYMPEHIANLVIHGLNDCGKVLCKSTVLILGLAYKPNVADIRTSKVAKTINTLKSYNIDILGFDPHADNQAIRDEFGIEVQSRLSVADIDCILLATPHKEFRSLDFSDLVHEMRSPPLVVTIGEEYDHGLFNEAGIEHKRL